MRCKIYPIVDEDIADVPFPKAKMAKSIPALTNPRTLDGYQQNSCLKYYPTYPAAAVLSMIAHFGLIL